MEKYGTYRTEDFLVDNRFLDWILVPDEASDEYWKTVFILYPACEHQADEARKILSALKITPGKEMPREMRRQITQQLQHHTDGGMVSNGAIRSWKTYVVAACLLVCCGVIFLLRQAQTTQKTDQLVIEQVDEKKAIKKITNTASESLLLLLPDTSTVILAANAHITYNEQTFTNDRVIYLSGEAFFEVTAQKGNPFRIKTDYLTATVLGTSFRIKAAETFAQSQVSVQSGIVEVRKKQATGSPSVKSEAPLYLTANQEMAHSETVSEHTSGTLTPNIIPPPTFDEHFKSTPLKTVLKALSNQYQIEISVADSTLEKRTISASLADTHLFEKLDLISKAVEASYRIIDGRIVFTRRAQEK